MGKFPSALVTVFVLDIALHAQLLTSPVQDYMNKTTLLNNILSSARATALSQKAQGSSAAGQPHSSAQSAPDPSSFAHSGNAVLPRKLAAKLGAQTEPHFIALISLYEQTARKDGFPPHDLAYALEYFLVNSYMTYHNLHDVEYSKDPRVKGGKDMFERLTLINEKKALKVVPYQERAVYQQFKAALASNATVGRMSDREKQELTELLAITFGVNFNAYMDAVNREDDRDIQLARQQAKTNLEKLTGVPVDSIRIDSTGLVM